MAKEQGISSDWDIDVYRNPWDSDEQWDVRTRFMEKHKDSIPEEELVCLAQVYTNIEFLGCSYPDDVSKRVKELANGLMGDDQNRRPAKGIPFVKAAEDTNEEPRSGVKRSSKLELPPAKHRPTEFIRPTNRPNAASYFTEEKPSTPHYNSSTQSGNQYQMQNYYTSNYKSSQEKFGHSLGSGVPLRREPEIVDMEPDRAWSGPSNSRNSANNADVSGKIASLQFKFDRLAKTLARLRDTPSITHGRVIKSLENCVSQAKLTFRANFKNSRCDVFISDVFIASGEGVIEKRARKVALTNALNLLCSPGLKISTKSGALVALVEKKQQFEVNSDKKEPDRVWSGPSQNQKRKISAFQRKFEKLREILTSNLRLNSLDKVIENFKMYCSQAELKNLLWKIKGVEASESEGDFKFKCDIFASFVLIESGKGIDEEAARQTACRNAIELLCNPTSRISAELGKLVGVHESEPVIIDEPKILGEVEQTQQCEVNNDEKEPDCAESALSINRKRQIKLLKPKYKRLREMLISGLLSTSLDKVMEKFNCYVRQAWLYSPKLKMCGVEAPEAERDFKFKCDISISGVFIASGKGNDQEAAHQTAIRNAIKLLSNPSMRISDDQSGRLCAVVDNDPKLVGEVEQTQQFKVNNDDKVVPKTKYFPVAKTIGKGVAKTIGKGVVNPGAPEPNNVEIKPTSIGDFGEFVIIHYLENIRLTAPGILQNSADYNRKKLIFSFTESEDSEAKCRCEVELDTFKLSEGRASTKVQAKLLAAEEALKKLRTVAYTIAVKRSVWTEGDVSKKNLNLPNDDEDEPIPESNVGNKLLRLMGWTGGGLGKPGNTGIEEPIQAVQIIGRQGLGLRDKSGVTPEFMGKLRRIVQQYARSQSEHDLAFTSEFSKEERAFVHRLACKLHLKNTSRGSGEDRYLVIAKRVQPKNLLNRLLTNVGPHEKYDLIPPTGI